MAVRPRQPHVRSVRTPEALASMAVWLESFDAATRQRVMAGLAKSHGSELIAAYQLNPGLIGGLRIRVGNDVLDGSVQGRLDRLANAF